MIDLEKLEVNEQSSIRISGSSVLYFDPFHIDKALGDADVVFLTHDHFDHYSPEDIEKVAGGNTIFVIPERMVKNIQGIGVDSKRIVSFRPDEEKELAVPDGSKVRVKAVPAYNKAKPFHPKSSKWCGYVVSMDDTVFYIAGDTDGLKENESIACDVAFIPIGGTYTMNYKEAAVFTNALKPGTVIPIHYGTVVGKPSDGERFAALIDKEISVVRKLS